MSRVLRLVFLALVLILVAMLSALTAMRIAIHGREVDVPDLVGLAPGEAESVLLDRGLRIDVESRFYSSDVAQGRILSQVPPAGTVVRRGWRVRVAESLGIARAKVPNVVGQSSRAAEINLRRRGLEVGKLAQVHLPNQPVDQVIAMSPPPDTVGPSPKVTLLLTASQEQGWVMPNLVGKKLADVSKLIDRSNLQHVEVREVHAPGTPAETIVDQSPRAGSKVSSSIALKVAR